MQIMSFAPFDKHPGNPAIPHREIGSAEYKEAVDRLAAHMYKISDDPSGSNPADYLSPEDADFCARFVEVANQHGWPHAGVIEMRTPGRALAPVGWLLFRDKSVPTWTKPLRTAKAGLTKVLFFPRQEEHKGYVFGRLGASLRQPVALCDDGLLRSLRGRELYKSKGLGWGRLPDPDLLKPALGIGKCEGVDYTNFKSATLKQLLMAKSKNALPDPDPTVQ